MQVPAKRCSVIRVTQIGAIYKKTKLFFHKEMCLVIILYFICLE